MTDKDSLINWASHVVEIYSPKIDPGSKPYILSKCEQLSELFLELETKGLLKNLKKEDVDYLKQRVETVLDNLEDVKRFYTTGLELVEKNEKEGEHAEGVELKDANGNVYFISARQIATINCLFYSSQIETIKTVLSGVINVSEPNGLGDLVRILRQRGVKRLEFFDELDIDLRNAVAHMDFEIEKTGVTYYVSKEKKPQTISITELIMKSINVDRSTFATIIMTVYVRYRR